MKLNTEQQFAVDCKDDKIICVAGAGAGKTTVMIERIKRLVAENVDPTTILALTFTNNAAINMLDKFKKDYIGSSYPEFKTFHAFCYSLIVKDENVRKKIGYINIPKIADDTILKKLETEAKLQCGIKLSKEKLEGRKALSPKEEKEFKIYQKALNKLIKANELITFDIMCNDICELFIQNDPSIILYKNKYKYIFCDEWQDTDSKQFRFIGSFPIGTNWFVIGDPLQQLYSFRGTSNEIMKMLISSPDWTTIKLTQNYRSTIPICKYANAFSKSYAKSEYRIEMQGQRDGDLVKVEYFCYPSYSTPLDDEHLNMLIADLKDVKEETAVLCRTNREVNYIIENLHNNGIACNTTSKNNDIANILRSCNDNDFMLNWLSTFLTEEQYSEYIRLAALADNPDIKWFAKLYGNIYEINRKGNLVITIRRILNDNIPATSKCKQILAKLNLDTDTLDFKGESSKDILNYITTKAELADNSAITVQTIHQSKGLEYDRVYVMNVDTDIFRLECEDDYNIAYVAFTRAKNHLIVYRGECR